jgi:adenosylhomocysteine nucleosidase
MKLLYWVGAGLRAGPSSLKSPTTRQIVIIIFYAFSREAAALKRRFESRTPLEMAGLKGFRGRLGGVEVAGIATGIGIERARQAARRAFEKIPEAKLAISTGVAGALSEGLAAGDLIVADRLVLSAEGRGDSAAQVLSIDRGELERLQESLRAAAIPFSTGAMLTSARALTTVADKRGAKAATGAVAVDMESAAIADEARIRGVPFVCVRAILDTADEDVIGAELPDEDGNVAPLRAAGFLIRNPGAIVKLSRLGRNLGIAAKSLADAIEAVVRHLG